METVPVSGFRIHGRAGPAIYLLWAAISLGLAFAKGGFSKDNLVHGGALLFLLLQIGFEHLRREPLQHPRRWFFRRALMGAMVVEGLHMFSNPLFPSLVITTSTPAIQAFRNFAIDIGFTLPVYGLIFGWVWFLVRRYRFGRWEYALLVSAGQALGDGIATWRANPGLLLLLPYVMVNYQAMSAAAYWTLADQLPASRPHGTWQKWTGTLVGLPLVYWVSAALLFTLARQFGFGK